MIKRKLNNEIMKDSLRAVFLNAKIYPESVKLVVL